MDDVASTLHTKQEGRADQSVIHNNTQSTANVEAQQKAATGGQSLNYNNELYRLLSYPDSLDFSVTSRLAKDGYYCRDNLANCCFCSKVINLMTPDPVIEPHNCEKIGNIELRENTSDYRYEYNRILSFLMKNWPKKPDDRIHVGALDLSFWGFYYTGEADAARCNFCRLEVRGWERGDTAEKEHRRWNPHCPFLSGSSVGNIPLGDEDSVESVQSDHSGLPIRHNISTSGSVASSADLGILKHSAAKHPEYASLSSRVNSYSSWPLSLVQRPPQLSDAGFYYTGKGDRVICYQCGGGLKDWGRTDQPWVEHAVWFPRCSYLNLQKGMHFIQQVQYLKQQADTPSFLNNSELSAVPSVVSDSAAAAPAVRPETPHFSAPASVVSQTNEVPVERQCKICLEKELGIVFLPCGHIAACVDCAPQLNNCPLCRGHLTAYIRAFLP